MNTKTDASLPARDPEKAVTLDELVATTFGLGYIPLAPGTWGSLAGVLFYWLVLKLIHNSYTSESSVRAAHGTVISWPGWMAAADIVLFVAFVGLITSHRTSLNRGMKDPQFVVIDETSGQMLTYFAALALLNWKYLLLGFILFRVFDIWKPFPARQAESLPGGWGIMADDWIAGIYAALGLWIARAAGL